MAIDLEAPLRFLHTAFRPDDWIAVLLKSHDTGGTAQRVGPMSLIANPKFQAWLRAENARRFSVFVSVNAIRPQRKARTRDAIGEIRHVFLDADRDGPAVLATIAARRDLPPPSCVIHSSPNRLHVLWRVSGFAKEGVEALQKQLAVELGTDKAATSCAQVTRLPGFFNHKYRPGPMRDGRVQVPATDGSDRGTSRWPLQSPVARALTVAGTAQRARAQGRWSAHVDTSPRFRQQSPATVGTRRRFVSAAVLFAALRLTTRTRSTCLRIGTAPAYRRGRRKNSEPS